MGGGSWSTRSSESLSAKYAGKTQQEVFKNKTIDTDMDPKNVMRVSRDSDAHPSSLGICVFLDETGSMGQIPEYLARHSLTTLMDTMTQEKAIEDVSLLFGAFGDQFTDKHPIQVGQFESEASLLDKWLTGIFLEHGGGGTKEESPILAWLFAARHTSLDCFEKRKQKGVLFTVSDEKCHPVLSAEHQIQFLGGTQATDITDIEALALVQQMYDVFHIHANDGGYPNDSAVFEYWKRMLPERFIVVENHQEISETIAATTAMLHGTSLSDAVASFSTDTAKRVSTSLATVGVGGAVSSPSNPSGGIKPL